MYALLWRSLPGPKPVKVILALALLVAVFLLLMEVIFPALSTLMPYNDVAF